MDRPPTFRPHWIPRTRDGWIATVAFLALLALAMPPFVHGVLDRPGAWVLGLPFLYTTLFAIYVVLIAVLVWAYRRGL